MQIGRKLVQRLVAAERRAVGVVLDRENLIPVLAVQADGQIPAAVQQIRPPVDHRHPTLGGQQDRIRVDALRRDGDLEAPQLQRPARRKIGQLRELLEAHRLRVMNGIRRRLGSAGAASVCSSRFGSVRKQTATVTDAITAASTSQNAGFL